MTNPFEMNDPFRVYLKVKVKEGQMDSFLQVAGDIIETVNTSEPEVLQLEGFFKFSDHLRKNAKLFSMVGELNTIRGMLVL